MASLYTIGHSTFPFEYFLQNLRMFDIKYLLDVRSVPYSRFAEVYNRENLKNLLDKHGIVYWYMGKFFGARPTDLSLYTSSHYLDFEKMRQSALFKKGMESVLLGLSRGNNIALMCTEKDPFDCHRAIMVTKGFADAGIMAKHILPGGSIQTQNELEERLLNKYFPARNQLDLFQTEKELSEDECKEKSYRLRNAEIGYHIMAG